MTVLEKSWPNIVTVSCLIVVAIIEAWQQAVAGIPLIHPRLDGIWHLVPFALLILAGISWVVGRRSRANPNIQQQAPSAQVAAAIVTPPTSSPIDVRAFFHSAYSGQVQAETERNVRAVIQSQPANERDEFVVRFIATGIVNFLYERIWLTIFRSQLLALQEMNTKLLRKEQLKTYYDNAAIENPALYEKYAFDGWLQYLRSQILILEHPGQTFEITVRGKDFLKFMLHFGYTAGHRKN